MKPLLKFMAADLPFANEVRIAGWLTQAEALIADGLSPDQAAERLGMPAATLARWREKIAAVPLPAARTFPRNRPASDPRPPTPRAVADLSNHK